MIVSVCYLSFPTTSWRDNWQHVQTFEEQRETKYWSYLLLLRSGLRYAILLLFSVCFFCPVSHLLSFCFSQSFNIDLLFQERLKWGKHPQPDHAWHRQQWYYYCVLLGMASWFEFSLGSGWPDSLNYYIYSAMTGWIITMLSRELHPAPWRPYWKMIILLPCLLVDDGGDDEWWSRHRPQRDPHSMRKFAAQYAQNKGCSHAALARLPILVGEPTNAKPVRPRDHPLWQRACYWVFMQGGRHQLSSEEGNQH